MQVDSLPAEPQGKPKNAGVGSLSPYPEDLPNPEIELGSPALQADSLPGKLEGLWVKNVSRFTLLAWAIDCVSACFFMLQISGCNRRGFSTNLMKIKDPDQF